MKRDISPEGFMVGDDGRFRTNSSALLDLNISSLRSISFHDSDIGDKDMLHIAPVYPDLLGIC